MMKRFILVITRGRNGRSQFFDLENFSKVGFEVRSW